MKKRLIIVALLAFVLGGCQAKPEEETRMGEVPVPGSALPENGVQSQATPVPVPEATPTPTAFQEPAEEIPAFGEVPEETGEPVILFGDESPDPGDRPSDEAVLEAYHRASEAYGWFDLTTLPLDYGAPARGENGVYHPVADERFPTMGALQTYLKGIFSDEVVDSLLPMDGEHYVEFDGVLCAMDGARGTNENTGAVTEMVIWPEDGDSLCTVHVAVELLWEDPAYPDGARRYDFPYQKVGDKWVFTHFEAIM